MARKHFCQFQNTTEKKMWYGTGQHVKGDSYSVPGLDGCFGLICVPQFELGIYFMAHSKLDPWHKEVEQNFWNYWSQSKYEGRQDFTIIWKYGSFGEENSTSVRNYFILRSRPIPTASHLAFPYNLGRDGPLIITTDPDDGHHTIIKDHVNEKKLCLDRYNDEMDQTITKEEYIRPKNIHLSREFIYRKQKGKSDQGVEAGRFIDKTWHSKYKEGIEKRAAFQKDEENNKCEICHKKFYVSKAMFGGLIKAGLINTQHRCKNCNMIICDACSRWERRLDKETKALTTSKLRLCLTCYNAPSEVDDPKWPVRLPTERTSLGVNPDDLARH